MAVVLLTSQSPARAANELVFVAAETDGNSFANTGKENVIITNGAVGALALTIETPGSVDTDLAIEDRLISIAAGQSHWLGPWPENAYNDSDGLVQLTYDDVTSITVAVVSPS